jgi:quercetin dioxygenase-like cupin family protein
MWRARHTVVSMSVIKYDSVRRLDRGSGILTVPLVTHVLPEATKIVTGTSAYPVGEGAPLHCHNCDEQVTLLSGHGEVEVDGALTQLEPYDSTYIEGGRFHAFRNTSDTEPMVILWIYAATEVTRTFADTGETVAHLSPDDLMGTPAEP